MKKAKRIVGILAFTAIIIFTMTAASCFGKGAGDSASNSGGRGRLTVKNIPSDVTIIALAVHTRSAPLSSLSDDYGEVVALATDTKKMPFRLGDVKNPIKGEWSGSGRHLVQITCMPSSDSTDPLKFTDHSKFVVANFSNGSATLDWNTMNNYSDLQW